LKEEVLDRTMWRNRFGVGFGPVVRQNTEWMNDLFSLTDKYLKNEDINHTSHALIFTVQV